MKETLTFFIGLLLCGNTEAQTKSTLIEIIRKDFQAINANSSLTIKTLDAEEFLDNTPDGGGELKGYFKKDSIVKIVEWIGISYGNRTREFYFKNSSLFFVYEKFQSFVINDSTGAVDHSNVKTSFEGRYYFNKDKLIDQKIAGKRTMEEDGPAIIKELQKSATENRKMLMKKK